MVLWGFGGLEASRLRDLQLRVVWFSISVIGIGCLGSLTKPTFVGFPAMTPYVLPQEGRVPICVVR